MVLLNVGDLLLVKYVSLSCDVYFLFVRKRLIIYREQVFFVFNLLFF